MKKAVKIFPVLFCAFATAGISAELNPLFQNNAVLQCGVRVPVWGTARDGEKITVTFAGLKVSTVASNGVEGAGGRGGHCYQQERWLKLCIKLCIKSSERLVTS
jgi:hypothetical protein